MDRTQPGKVPVDQRVDQRLAEHPPVVAGNRNTEQSYLELLFNYPRGEKTFNIFEGLKQGLSGELVYAHIGAFENLECHFIGEIPTRVRAVPWNRLDNRQLGA